ncbi:hypothetical protein JW865_09625, partial [Candidatus Bathyarchaeota archaeon]|nr:hypothetical protein [Candidatus Bathyarchaeota archaeon]
NRPFNSLTQKKIRVPYNEIEKIEKNLCNIFKINNIKYGLTGFSGLKRYYEYTISYPLIHVYVSNMNIIEKINKGEGPIPIIFLKPDQDSILKQTNKIDGYQVCDNIQVIIDLFSSGIGRDAAYNYIKEMKQ